MTEELPGDIFATLTGPVDPAMVQRIFHWFAYFVSGGAKNIHLLFHSLGGSVSDGIAIHNYLTNLPIQITTYNPGNICSVGDRPYGAIP